MKSATKKLNFGKAAEILRNILSSKYLPFVTAAITVGCYYLGLDLLTYYYIVISGVAVLLLLDDATPIFSNFLFMSIAVSKINSPSPNAMGSDFYFRPAVLAQLIILIVIFAAAAIYRIVRAAMRKEFKLSPVFFGLCGLSVTFLANGLFSSDYNPMNIVYGLFMAGSFLGIFTLMKDNVSCTKESFEKVAYAFVAFSAALLLELLVVYCTTEGIIQDGCVIRNKITFGWGTYNQIGCFMVLCIPAVFYVAHNHKFGYLFFLYSMVVGAGAIFTMSRQAMLCSVIVYPLCFAILLLRGKNKLINRIIGGIALVIGIVFVGIYYRELFNFFHSLLISLKTGSGRTGLWVKAWNNFESAPLFGTGFYAKLPPSLNTVGLDIIPLMYHDTVLQLLASCGILGLIAYVIHRIQTIVSFFKNITRERVFIAITVSALLLINLLHNHLFYIFPTIMYSSMIAMLVKSENIK